MRRWLPLRALEMDPELQMRASGLDPDTVEDYRRPRRKPMPPVLVVQVGAKYWLVDGYHRWEALARQGAEQIFCEIVQGTPLTAFGLALGANAENGLQRTNADKRRAVTCAIRRNEADGLGWSNVQIADLCAVDEGLVRKVKQEIKWAAKDLGLSEDEADTTWEPRAPLERSSTPPVVLPIRDESEGEAPEPTAEQEARWAARERIAETLKELSRDLKALGILAPQVAALDQIWSAVVAAV